MQWDRKEALVSLGLYGLKDSKKWVKKKRMGQGIGDREARCELSEKESEVRFKLSRLNSPLFCFIPANRYEKYTLYTYI